MSLFHYQFFTYYFLVSLYFSFLGGGETAYKTFPSVDVIYSIIIYEQEKIYPGWED